MNRREFLKGSAWMGAAAFAAGCQLNRWGFGEGGQMQNYAYCKLMGRRIRVGFIGIGEPRPDIALEFSRKWCGGTVEKLTMDGVWKAVGTASDAFRAEGLSWPAMTPEFFKVTLR